MLVKEGQGLDGSVSKLLGFYTEVAGEGKA